MRFFLLIVSIFFSCNNQSNTLPFSTGSNSELIIVVDDSHWHNRFKEESSKVFKEIIPGLPKDEALFSIIQVNHKEFKSILKTHTNVILMLPNIDFHLQKDKWSKGQHVFQIPLNIENEELNHTLNEIKHLLINKENNELRARFQKKSQKNIEKDIFKNFKLKCIIPKEYNVVLSNESICWLNYDSESSDLIKNILIFSFVPKLNNIQTQVLNKTDSIFATHLHGEKLGDFVVIEPNYPPFYIKNTYRGLWRLKEAFMGGPFLIKTYYFENEVVVAIGLVFDPSRAKRKYIKEFESILQ